MQFDATEQALIASSFRALAVDAPGAAACFYSHLFRLLPEAQDLFVADMQRQGAKLAQTLQVIVDQVGNWGLLRVTVEDLAIRHLAYGVRAEHYDAVSEALIAMLQERLGALCSDETVRVWRKAYGEVQSIMLEFAYPADADTA